MSIYGGSAFEKLRAERDQLKAENESLRSQLDCSQGDFRQLEKIVNRMRKDAQLLDILVEAMAEVKATSDGDSDQPISEIVSGCLAEIAAISSPENN